MLSPMVGTGTFAAGFLLGSISPSLTNVVPRWGQAVGWKNYHEQWLSEGFAQYFAALWAQQSRGDRVFLDMLRQFRRWSLSVSRWSTAC